MFCLCGLLCSTQPTQAKMRENNLENFLKGKTYDFFLISQDKHVARYKKVYFESRLRSGRGNAVTPIETK